MSKSEVYKLKSDTNKGFSCTSVSQRHLGRTERKKVSLTPYLEALPCAVCMLHDHAMSWYPGRQTVTILTSLLLMRLLILSNTATGGRRQRNSLDLLCSAHTPPGMWSSGHCWGSCRPVPWLRSQEQRDISVCCPDIQGILWYCCLSTCCSVSLARLTDKIAIV